MKKCSRCLEVKPLSEFGMRNRIVKGEKVKRYLSYCRKCNNEHSKKRYYEMRSNNLKCIYRFLDIDNNVIYVGKTERLRYRMNYHFSRTGHLPKECYESVYRVQFIAMTSTVLMDMKEMYYINLYKPKFNKNHLYNEPGFIISDFSSDEWLDYSEDVFYKLENMRETKIGNLISPNECDIKRVNSIFKRKRNNNYLVYIEYTNFEGATKQKRKGTFKNKKDADELIKDLKSIYFI